MYVTQVTDGDVRVICAVATPRVQAVECWRVSGLGERLLQISEFTQVLRVMYLLSIFISLFCCYVPCVCVRQEEWLCRLRRFGVEPLTHTHVDKGSEEFYKYMLPEPCTGDTAQPSASRSSASPSPRCQVPHHPLPVVPLV